MKHANIAKMCASLCKYKRKYDPEVIIPYLTFFPASIEQPLQKDTLVPPQALVKHISIKLQEKYGRSGPVWDGSGENIPQMIPDGLPKTLKALTGFISPMCTHVFSVDTATVMNVLLCKGLIQKCPNKRAYVFGINKGASAEVKVLEIAVPAGLMGKVIGRGGRHMNPLIKACPSTQFGITGAEVAQGTIRLVTSSIDSSSAIVALRDRILSLVANARQGGQKCAAKKKRAKTTGSFSVSGYPASPCQSAEDVYDDTKAQARRSRQRKAKSSSRVLGGMRAKSRKQTVSSWNGAIPCEPSTVECHGRDKRRRERIAKLACEQESERACFSGLRGGQRKWQPKGRRQGKGLLVLEARRPLQCRTAVARLETHVAHMPRAGMYTRGA
jgi:hypothetical protein